MNNKILQQDDQINFKVLIDRIWLKKLQVVLITALFSIFFIFYSLSIENTYISQSILKVNNDSNSAFSEYSGLASMAGIDLGGGGKRILWKILRQYLHQ